MIRDIVLVPDARLQTPCAPVEVFGAELERIVRDLEDTMRASPGCVGIAAPQIGDLVRVALVDTSVHRKFGAQSQGYFVLVNPSITAAEGEQVGREGCLSLPDFTANVRRAPFVTVRFQTPQGQTRHLTCRDFEAVAMQHEIDHLDGILFLDRVTNLQTDLFPRKTGRK